MFDLLIKFSNEAPEFINVVLFDVVERDVGFLELLKLLVLSELLQILESLAGLVHVVEDQLLETTP